MIKEMFMARKDEKEQLAEIRNLAEQVERLTGQVKALTTLKDRTAELNAVSDRLEQAKLELERVNEKHAREKRQTEHEVGLLKKAQEQDSAYQTKKIELAQEAAVLKVKQENLGADRKRFEDQMTFQRDFMKAETDRIATYAEQLMALIPKVNVDLSTPARLGRSAKE